MNLLLVATAPTVYGIETLLPWLLLQILFSFVATAPTVYGIETCCFLFRGNRSSNCCNSTYRLRYWNWNHCIAFNATECVATAPTVYGIETCLNFFVVVVFDWFCCNSTYRLRYWNSTTPTSKRDSFAVATAPTVYGIETYFNTIIDGTNT